MQKPAIKIKQFSINLFLTTATLVVLAVEAYFAYEYLYKNLTAEPGVVQNERIVRVDNASYKSSMDYLNQLVSFVSGVPNLQNTNPFK